MTLAGFRCKNPYEILSKEEIEQIHQGSLEILAETGMTVAHKEARKVLAESGCLVDNETQRVKFPPNLVQWAIDPCPHTFSLKARNPDHTLNLGGDVIYFASFPGFTWLDLDSQERREANVEDCAMLVRLCDALPMVHTLFQPVAHRRDIPPEVELEWVHATELRNTDKTIET